MKGKKPRMGSRTGSWRREKKHWAAGQRWRKNSDREQDGVTENKKK